MVLHFVNFWRSYEFFNFFENPLRKFFKNEDHLKTPWRRRDSEKFYITVLFPSPSWSFSFFRFFCKTIFSGFGFFPNSTHGAKNRQKYTYRFWKNQELILEQKSELIFCAESRAEQKPFLVFQIGTLELEIFAKKRFCC